MARCDLRYRSLLLRCRANGSLTACWWHLRPRSLLCHDERRAIVRWIHQSRLKWSALSRGHRRWKMNTKNPLESYLVFCNGTCSQHLCNLNGARSDKAVPTLFWHRFLLTRPRTHCLLQVQQKYCLTYCGHYRCSLSTVAGVTIDCCVRWLGTLCRDTCCPQWHTTDTRRRKLHGRLFAFGAAENGAQPLLTGESSHGVATESAWQSGVRMLGSFGGPNRSHCAPPVMSINPDGTLAVVFQQGGRSILQMARETLYDRCCPFWYIFNSRCCLWSSWS